MGRAAGTPAGASRSGASDGDQLAVFAPADPEAVTDLADRRPRADRLDDGRHEIAIAGRSRLEGIEGGAPRSLVAFGSHAPDTFDLAPLPLRVDAVDRRRRDGLVAVTVDPDHDLVARLDLLLNAVCRLL